MSSPLGTVCEMAVKKFYEQGQRTNTEWTAYNVSPFVYAARDKVLHLFLETGSIGRNYGTGKPGQLSIEGYTVRELTVGMDGDVPFITLPSEFADLRDDAGIMIAPKGRTNNFRKVPYGYQWSGREFMYAEGNVAWWVTPSKRIEFYSPPMTPTVSLLTVDTTPMPGEVDLDATLTFPAHLLTTIIEETVLLMGNQVVPDQSVNNRDQKPS